MREEEHFCGQGLRILESGLMSSFAEMNETKDTILVGNECPFYNSVVRGMVDLIPDCGETLLLI